MGEPIMISLRANYLFNGNLCPRDLIEHNRSAENIADVLYNVKFIQTKDIQEELVKRFMDVKDLFSNPLRFDSKVNIILGERDYLDEVLASDNWYLKNHPGFLMTDFKGRHVTKNSDKFEIDRISLDKMKLDRRIYSVGFLVKELNIPPLSG